MPFDGFVTRCVAEELNIILTGGRIDKIAQPERDTVIMTVRNHGQNHRLLLSANAASPRVHLTDTSKENPLKAPMFCMVLRKHLGGGKIIGITADGFERVIKIDIESLTELKDISRKTLITEIMGKRSNIVLTNSDGRVIDAITHVDSDMNSVREIMPARVYAPPPPQQDKLIPGIADTDGIMSRIEIMQEEQPMKKVCDALLETVMGASPLFCRETLLRAAIDAKAPLALIDSQEISALSTALDRVIDGILSQKYAPCVAFRDGGKPVDFYCLPLLTTGTDIQPFDTMSAAADAYYSSIADAESLRQRKASLVKLVNNNIARCKKKLAIQQESLREAANRETLKLCGELILANIYAIPAGAATARLKNYYTESYIDVALDENMSPQANAQKYFKKYRKAVSTWKHAEAQAVDSARELGYLESVLHELEMCVSRQEINEVRDELISQKYVHARQTNQKDGKRGTRSPSSKRQSLHSSSSSSPFSPSYSPSSSSSSSSSSSAGPRQFVSSDGLSIYVGRNNRQNDHLTLKVAASNDIWLHTKNIPGSHVLIKKRQGEIPQVTLLEAASLAALYSRAALSTHVSVDYTQARHVRKPSGAKPGMVIYDNHRTILASPDEALAARLSADIGPQKN